MCPRGRNVTKHKIRTKNDQNCVCECFFFVPLIILVLHQHRWSARRLPLRSSFVNKSQQRRTSQTLKICILYREEVFLRMMGSHFVSFFLSFSLCLFATSICETYYGPQNCSVCINIYTRMLLVLLFKVLLTPNFIPNSEQSVMCTCRRF